MASAHLSSDKPLRIGVDVGSTTVKLLVLDERDNVVFSVYRRHHSDIRATIAGIIDEGLASVGEREATMTITGSGGLLLANWLDVPFIQEVIANKTAIERINWNIVGRLAGCLGLAKALEAAGGTKIIADTFAKLVGTSLSPFILFAILVLLVLVVSEFMSNSTAILIVLPIVLAILLTNCTCIILVEI